MPLLPLLYIQGKRIRKEVPILPEAKGNYGVVNCDSSKDALNVVFIGESTIAGVGVDTHAEGFAGSFSKSFSNKLNRNVSWRVYARSGYTIKQVRERLLPKIENYKPDLFVIGLGGNDAFTLNTPWRWAREVEKLIADLKSIQADAVIVFNNMPPIKSFPAFTPLIKFVIGNLVEILGVSLSQTVKGIKDVYYAEEVISLKTWGDKYAPNSTDADFFSDGVHPSLITYQSWAKEMASMIAEEEKILAKLLG